MNIIEKKAHCAENHLRWTASDERKYNKAILNEKRDMFADFRIPFPEDIASGFNAEVVKGNKNAEVYLDNLCQSYIQFALDNYGKVMHELIKSVHGGETIYETEIMNILKKEFHISSIEDRRETCRLAIKEMVKANLIECQGSYKGDKLYAI